MDIQHLFKVLWRKKMLLLAIMCVSAILAFVAASLQKPTYFSKAILSTGITVDKGIDIGENAGFVQQYEIIAKFDNLIANMTSRSSIRQLSYKLLLHDLSATAKSEEPFRTLSEENAAEFSKKELEDLMSKIRPSKEQDIIMNITLTQEYDALYNKIAKAYGYDFESILKNLEVTRMGETDYLNVLFTAEHPELCEFAVNTFCESFITSAKVSQSQDESEEVKFFKKQVEDKKAVLDQVNKDLDNFRRNKAIVDLKAQKESIVGQIAELEVRREEERKRLSGKRKNIENLNKYIDKSVNDGASTYSNSAELNEEFSKVQSDIKSLREQMVGKNDPKLQRKLEDLNAERLRITAQLSNRKTAKDSDFEEKTDKLTDVRIDTEMDLADAEGAVQSLDTEIARLRGRASSLVSADSYLENLNGQKSIALEEYLQAVQAFNNANVKALGTESPLTIFEHAQVPEKPAPQNRALFSAFAGIASFSLSSFILFLVTLFDTRITSPEYFEQQTKTPLLGSVNKINANTIDLEDLFMQDGKGKGIQAFKESLRRIRVRLINSGAKTILFSSTAPETGKTFAMLSLAQSLSRNKKKVLLIDTNFKNNTLTSFANKELHNNPLYNGYMEEANFNENYEEFEVEVSDEELTQEEQAGTGELKKISTTVDVLSDRKQHKNATNFILDGKMDIIGNVQSSHSPSEILAGKDFNSILEGFERDYDYILMEGAALNTYSDTQELVAYADKVIVVFDAEKPISQQDRESIKYLKSIGDKYLGGILNKVDLRNFK